MKPFKVVFKVIGGGPKGVNVESYEAASKWMRAHILESNIGPTFKGCEIYDRATKQQVAHVSYDGRVWAGATYQVGDVPVYDATAEEEFNNILARAENHDHLNLLANAGWVELFPSEDSWSFRHEKFPGVTLVWAHGESKAKARYES